jgi:hypothetical protein
MSCSATPSPDSPPISPSLDSNEGDERLESLKQNDNEAISSNIEPLLSSSSHIISSFLSSPNTSPDSFSIYRNISHKLSQHLQLISLANHSTIPHAKLVAVTELFNVIEIFLKSIQRSENNSPQTTLSWFEMIVMNCLSHLRSFQNYEYQINDLMKEVGIIPLQLSEKVDHPSEIRQDLEALCHEISTFLFSSCPQQKKNYLQFLHQKVLLLLVEWDRLNDSILKMKILFEYTLKLFQMKAEIAEAEKEALRNSPEPKDPPTAPQIEPENRTCAELVEIVNIVEDFIHNPIQFPQQLALVDSLNESFMKSLNALDKSLIEPFSQDINRFHDSMKILHQLSVLPLHSVDRFHQLYACIGRENESEYVDKEESLRRDALTQLEVSSSQVTLEDSPPVVVAASTSATSSGRFGDVVIRGRIGSRALSIRVYHTKKPTFSDEEMRSIENEVLLMSLFHHSSILQTYGYCKTDRQTVYLLLEPAPIGSLWDVLMDKERTPSIPLSLSLGWISDILSALCYLHDKRIVHGDIRAENVMLSDGLICKLTDCGLTRPLSSQPSSSTTRSENELLYLSPEVRMDGHRSHRSDVYSCGLTSYQILDRCHPPHRLPRQHVLLYASSLSVSSLVVFFEGCLKETPVDRMSSREALDLIRGVQESEEFVGDPRQSRGSPNYEEVELLYLPLADPLMKHSLVCSFFLFSL